MGGDADLRQTARYTIGAVTSACWRGEPTSANGVAVGGCILLCDTAQVPRHLRRLAPLNTLRAYTHVICGVPTMAGGIFVSYRRDDSRHAAGRPLDRLRQTYGAHQLFMDVDNVAPGLDFVKVLSEQVAACNVMLVIIGPKWLDARDDAGARRLDKPNDFVRLELEAALKRDVRVIPVLVDGASIPHEDTLPPPLRPLAKRQSVRLTHERFGSEVDDLVRSLRDAVRPAKRRWGIGRNKAPSVPSTTPKVWTATANSIETGSESRPSRGLTPVRLTLRPLGFAVSGLVVGFVLFACTTFLLGRFLFGVLGFPFNKWALTVLLASLTALWLLLFVWSASVEATSTLRFVAPTAFGAAAMFALTLLGLALTNSAIPEGSLVIGAVVSVYLLVVWLYLRKAMSVGAMGSSEVTHRPPPDAQVGSRSPAPPPLPSPRTR